MSSIIKLRDITFSYDKNQDLFADFSLNIEKQSIYCLIGPNGAGKTTLLKIMSGLIKPKVGDVNIIDGNYEDNSEKIYNNLFISIDTPSFYQHLSGYDNLKIICRYRNIDDHKIKYVLDLFDLKKDKKIIKKYSQGMKQKINLAASFLFNPKIVILDEPLNNLDPSTIIFLREMILKLNKEKEVTFVISSHLLREIGSFCTNYCIIDNGNFIESGVLTGDLEVLENKYLSSIHKK